MVGWLGIVYVPTVVKQLREIPDHATFREKENTLGWLDKLGGFLSLTLCNLANFDQLCLPKYRCYNSV